MKASTTAWMAAGALFLAAGMAQAGTTTISNSNSGWYDDTGEHDSTNQNYFTGSISGNTFRSFFVFDLTAVTETITSAKVTLYSFDVSGGGGPVDLYDVSTPIPTLEAGGSGLTGIYDDLGTGNVYGSQSVTTDNTFYTWSLNAAALADLNAARGGMFALGGRLAVGDGYVFGFSDFNKANVLTLDTASPVPLPSGAWMGLGAFGLLGVTTWRRRRLLARTAI